MPNQFKLSQSGLLKLPGEIRNTIWEMVLGNQTLHFNQLPHGFNLTACASHITEEKANKMAMAEHPDKMFFARDSEYSQRWAPSTNDELMDRHFNCDRAIAPIVTFDLLRVCRQMYGMPLALVYLADHSLDMPRQPLCLTARTHGPSTRPSHSRNS
jgi:hypothetical protein